MDHSTEKDSSRTEIYPGGIAVSQSVVKSWLFIHWANYMVHF
jgi:hypothetical protein